MQNNPMKNKLQRIAPAWHAEAKQLLADNFAAIHVAFLDSTKKAVWLGIFLNQIKQRGKEDGSIPHGEFLPWLKKNLPEFSERQVRNYMNLATNICEKGKFQITEFPEFAQNGNNCRFSVTELPEAIVKMIEGKTQQQLFLEFKNVDADGNPLKAGCKPGKSKLTQEELADIADPLLEIENDLISFTQKDDLTFCDIESTPRLVRFRDHLTACLERLNLELNRRKK